MALISKKKIPFRVNQQLRKYLMKYEREYALPIEYSDLLRFSSKISLYDKAGNDTLWETVFYPPSDMDEVYAALKSIYADLKASGDESVMKHLVVDRVDICPYANSMPFRIRIVNQVNDNFDYFYIKRADASRIYGLELEHILSPNRITYVTHGQTLVEEHIAGIPGEQFFRKNLNDPQLNPIRLAKEFVKFTERCFIQLLGDMHSSNFVVVTTPDFEENYYRIRAIDFDQQSYEGNISVYRPNLFKQNNPLVDMGMKFIKVESLKQYQREERAMMANRVRTEQQRLNDLMSVMAKDEISLPENEDRLKHSLARHYGRDSFLKCKSMGEIVWTSLEVVMKY